MRERSLALSLPDFGLSLAKHRHLPQARLTAPSRASLFLSEEIDSFPVPNNGAFPDKSEDVSRSFSVLLLFASFLIRYKD